MQRSTLSRALVSLPPAFLLATACLDTGANEDAGENTTAPTDPEGGTDTDVPAGCADPDDPGATRIGLSADIEGGMTLGCDTIWILETIVFVRGGELDIEPGTTIQGQNNSALVIDTDATIHAAGTADAPIVFTSAQPEGQRNRGDWGGLVLLGTATINVEGGQSTAEGFANPPIYGGDDPAHSCGTLQYVRSEWAGFAISEGNELNAITFYACGTDTVVDHVQAHMGSDDGLEMFGGGFDASYIVVTGAADDSVDIDEGFTGSLQFIYIHQDPGVGDNAFELSTQGDVFDAEPRTNPAIANATILGSGATGDNSKGVTLKEGTFAGIYNSVFTNITNEAIRFSNASTQAAAEAGDIALARVLFGTHADPGFTADADAEAPDPIHWTDDEAEAWVLGQPGVQDGVDPGFGDLGFGTAEIVPPADSRAAGVAPPPAPFAATDYAGAVAPGAAEDWTQAGWIRHDD